MIFGQREESTEWEDMNWGKSIVQAAEEQALPRDYKTEMSILTLLPDFHSIFFSQMFQFAFFIVVWLGTELLSRELLESPFQNFFQYTHLFQSCS